MSCSGTSAPQHCWSPSTARSSSPGAGPSRCTWCSTPPAGSGSSRCASTPWTTSGRSASTSGRRHPQPHPRVSCWAHQLVRERL